MVVPDARDRAVEGTVVPRRPGLSDDAVDLALGVVSLAAAAGRGVARLPEALVHRLPLPRAVRDLAHRSRETTLARGHASRLEAEKLLRELADTLVPLVVREVLERIDVAALVQRYVDLDRIAGQLDVDAVVARADLDAAVARVDLDRVLDRVDVDGIAGRLDLDLVLDRVDVDGIADRLDLDRVLARLDLIGLATWIADGMDLPGLVRASTGSISSDVVRGVRAQSADADHALERVVDRFLRRRGRRTAVGDGDGRDGP